MGFFTNGPLEYPANQGMPVRQYKLSRAPTSSDYKNFTIGDEWLDTSADIWYKMADKTSTMGVWIQMGGTPLSNLELLPDSGTTPVIPNGSDQITVTGANGITTVGGVNTLTITTSGSGPIPTDFLPDAGTSPVVANAMGELTIAGGTNCTTTGGLNTITWDVTGMATDFLVDAGTSPVVPDGSGQVTLTGGAGLITTTGSLNTVTFDVAPVWASIHPDAGTDPVVGDVSNEVSVLGDGGITTTGSLNTLTIGISGGGSLPLDFLVDAGTSPVVADAMNQLTVTGTDGLVTTGSLNTISIGTGGIAFPLNFIPDTGTSPVNADASNDLNVVGADGIQVTGSLATLTIGIGGATPLPIEFLPDAGTSPVVLSATNQVSIIGGTNVTTTGGLNSITFDATGGGGGTTDFIVDAGTSPVVPNGSGEVTITGQPTFIDTTGSTNTITLVPSDAFLQRTGCQTYNLGLTVASPDLTINAADGSALSASNPGYVAFGGNVYTLTANVAIEDNAGTNSFGTTQFGLGSIGSWGTRPIPFFLYVVKDTTTTDIRFACARLPNYVQSPNNVAFIADTVTSISNFERGLFLFTSATRANYVSAECWQLGAFFMQFDGTNFTFYTTSQNQFGVLALDRWNIFPQELDSAGTSSWFWDNGGTAPVMTLDGNYNYLYSTQPNGFHITLTSLVDTTGTGAVTARLSGPYRNPVQSVTAGSFSLLGGSTDFTGSVLSIGGGGRYYEFYTSGGAPLLNTDIVSGQTFSCSIFRYFETFAVAP